jgi:hypothetical protein
MIRRLLLAIKFRRDPALAYTGRGAWRAAARHS